MPNVKPGDLCLVVGARVTKELIGRIVEVESLAHNMDTVVSNCGTRMELDKDTNEKVFWCKGENLPWKNRDGFTRLYGKVPIGDDRLVKIKDGDLTLDEKTEISKNTPLTKEKETA